MEIEFLKRVLEAAIFALGRPVTVDHLQTLFQDQYEPPSKDDIKQALELLAADCEHRGVELKRVASGYQFQSKQEYALLLQQLWEEKPARYSRALLETLALIAYRQPITRGEIEEVRGVAVSSHIIKTLMEREWVKSVGHKEVPGRPALYATTKEFLDYFNLESIKDLPKLEALKDIEAFGKQLDLDMQMQNALSPEAIPGVAAEEVESNVLLLASEPVQSQAEEIALEDAESTITEMTSHQ